MKVLHLTLEKKWFDMIASGVKKEEYRQIKPYWQKRLNGKSFDAVKFTNGYGADKPTMTLKVLGIYQSLGIIEWGAPERVPVYIISLGESI